MSVEADFVDEMKQLMWLRNLEEQMLNLLRG